MLAVDTATQAFAKPRTGWRPQFSLAALVLVVFLIGTVLMVLLATGDAQRLQRELQSERARVSELLAERRQLRDKLGVVSVENPCNIHAIARSRDRFNTSWEWELYLPNRSFSAFYSFVKVGADGTLLESPKRQIWLGLKGGQSAVYAVELSTFRLSPSAFQGTVYSGKPLKYGNLSEANPVSPEVCDALEKNRFFRHHQMGKDGTVVLPEQERIVLLWPDVYLWPDVNGIKGRSDYHDVHNCQGLTVWLEEVK